jgi:hypothetical protein
MWRDAPIGEVIARRGAAVWTDITRKPAWSLDPHKKT